MWGGRGTRGRGGRGRGDGGRGPNKDSNCSGTETPSKEEEAESPAESESPEVSNEDRGVLAGIEAGKSDQFK